MPGECLLANLDAPFAVPAKIALWADVVWACPPFLPSRPVVVANVSAMVD